MSLSIQLLFPCCHPEIKTGEAEKQSRTLASASSHAITALVIALIAGAAAAFGAYLLIQGTFLWTALAGGGMIVATGTISYVFLRCLLGHTINHKQEKTVDSSAPLPTTPALPQTTPPAPKQKYLIQKVHHYPGDLAPAEKEQMEAVWMNPSTLHIKFQEREDFTITILNQDLFESGAEVIVNAANTHLGGGGGIDGLIHSKGGAEYAAAHAELRTEYSARYVNGYAAMIGSGQLKHTHHIDHVIVVAGPAGATNPQKENELYSCYFNSLVVAHEQQLTSIAFPSISTGIFSFPKDRAAAISLRAIYDFLTQYPESPLKTISIHFLNDSDLGSYQEAASIKQ